MRYICTGFAVLVCTHTLTVTAQTVYNNTPDWESTDTPVSTGAALVDLDRDGWLDLVTANGNDMAQQRLKVYYNIGDGTFPDTGEWRSDDRGYNGHLDVADVNGDGWPDVAVAHLGTGAVTINAAKLYLNNGGTLSLLPDWSSTQMANAFGVAFGDVNNDGRPDLAVATGWAYSNPHAFRNSVHLNVGGQLEATPSWQSDDTWDYSGVLWVDGDGDGWLDLVGMGNNTDTWIYRNLGGGLETTASWRTTNNSGQFAIIAAAGDITGDGHPELFTTDNNQLFGGSGRFLQYTGLAGGLFTQTPTWSYFDGYCSAVALADVDADGDLDLATGAWFDRTRLFYNAGGGFGAGPDWNSAATSTVEKIVFGDIDNDGLRSRIMTVPADGRRLIYLDHQPVQSVDEVSVDGVVLLPDEYTFSREHGWLVLGRTPAVDTQVFYTYSRRLDMAVANWDSTIGNQVYYNQLVDPGDLDEDGDVDLNDFATLATCFGGSAVTTPPSGCLPADFAASDLDGDGDVDLNDFSSFAANFTG